MIWRVNFPTETQRISVGFSESSANLNAKFTESQTPGDSTAALFPENNLNADSDALGTIIDESKDIEAEFGEKQIVHEGGTAFVPGHALELVGGVLNVLTAHEPEPDNTLPITAAAVDTVVGNIEVLLKTI